MNTPKSPCKEICDYDPVIQYCQSCGRTLQEIKEWFAATKERKVEIIKTAKQRLKK